MVAQYLKELKALQEENFRLKRIFVDLSLDHRILNNVIEKVLNLCERKEQGEGVMEAEGDQYS